MSQMRSQSGGIRRVALPVWNDRVSPVFETCSRYLMVDCRDKEVCRRRSRDCLNLDQLGRVRLLLEEKADLLICGAITEVSLTIIEAQGIQVKPFVTGRSEKVLQAYLNGQLGSAGFSLPGCARGQRRRFRGGR